MITGTSEKRDVKRIIDVSHECAEGWHTFTSEQIPGLFVTVYETNLEGAFHDIPTAIEDLIRLDYKREVHVEPQITFDEYLAQLPPSHKPAATKRHYFTIEDRLAA